MHFGTASLIKVWLLAFCRPIFAYNCNTTAILEQNGVFPDVIDPFPQTAQIYVKFQNASVCFGDAVSNSDVETRPEVQIVFSKSPKGKSYVLAMDDPDAPREFSQICHMVYADIKPDVEANYIYTVDYNASRALAPYVAPSPVGLGYHRYTIVVLEQGEKPVQNLPNHTIVGCPQYENRPNWGTGNIGSGLKEYARKNDLTPVAINYFLAGNVNSSTSVKSSNCTCKLPTHSSPSSTHGSPVSNSAAQVIPTIAPIMSITFAITLVCAV